MVHSALTAHQGLQTAAPEVAAAELARITGLVAQVTKAGIRRLKATTAGTKAAVIKAAEVAVQARPETPMGNPPEAMAQRLLILGRLLLMLVVVALGMAVALEALALEAQAVAGMALLLAALATDRRAR